MDQRKIIEDFDYKRISKLVGSCERRLSFRLKECYGSGDMYVYEVTPGVYLGYNDYRKMKTIVNDGTSPFRSDSMIMHYCTDGGFRINMQNGLSASINKNDFLFYAGDADFSDCRLKESGCEIVSLFTYRDDFIGSLSKTLGIERECLQDFYLKIRNRDEILASKTDMESTCIVDQIMKAVRNDDLAMIRIKALELIYYNIRNIDRLGDLSKKMYKKEAIDKVESVRTFMEENWNETYTLDELSKRFAISQTYLKEIFKYMYESGPATYMRRYRLKKSLELLEETSLTIIEIANMVGYSNPSKFSKAFKNEFKILPSKYNRR